MNTPETLWRWSAVDIAAAVRSRDISCREATASVLARIAQLNPRINALAEVLAEQALASADAADQQVMSGAPLGPLHGVPVTIKINVDQAGHATTNGVIPLKDNIAREDAPVVAHWRNAGAIIVGRSNTATYSSRWFTDNGLHGRTLNPWDADITPGGSSGGAAAAVACGMGALAHGNDIGGSIRYPAYACGVPGLRPTIGRVPAYNPSASAERGITPQLMSVQGAMARSMADLRLGYHAMARPDPRDPAWVPAPLELPPPAGPIRVALFKHCPGIPIDPAVGQALDSAAQWLQQAGYAVEEAALPDFLEAAALWRTLITDDSRRNIIAGVEHHGDEAMRRSQRIEEIVAAGLRHAVDHVALAAAPGTGAQLVGLPARLPAGADAGVVAAPVRARRRPRLAGTDACAARRPEPAARHGHARHAGPLGTHRHGRWHPRRRATDGVALQGRPAAASRPGHRRRSALHPIHRPVIPRRQTRSNA